MNAYQRIISGQCPLGYRNFRHCLLCKFHRDPENSQSVESRVTCFKGIQKTIFDIPGVKAEVPF